MASVETFTDIHSSLSGEDISEELSDNVSEEENSDYSSDSSLRPSALEQAEQARASGRRLQGQQATSPAEANPVVSGALARESCFPQVYKFFADGGDEWKSTIQKLASEFLNCERTEISVLKNLVSFSMSDLFSHAWHLLSSAERSSTYGRFIYLPNPPNMFETHNTDRVAIASFMVRTAAELDRTREAVSQFCLRHAVVKSAVTEETLRLKHCSSALCSLDDLTFKPSWESEVDAITRSYSEDDQGETEVSLFDFSVVFAVPVLDVKMSLQNLQMLDYLVSKCIKRSSFDILSSWGVQHITRVLMYQLELEARKEVVEDRRWLSEAYTLLYKIVIVSGDINKLLSLLRWGYQFDKYADGLCVNGLKSLLCAIEHRNFGRKRLTLPTNVPRGELVSLNQPFETLSLSTVLGMCVQFQDDAVTVVVLCAKGAFRFSLRAPYDLLGSNPFYNIAKCMGVYDEGERIAVITNGGVDYLNTASLHKIETVSFPYDDNDREAFYVYTGARTFVRPHVRLGSPARPYFSGDSHSGTMDPSSLPVRRNCESFSVQFCLLPMPPATHTEMKLLTLVSEEKHVVSISIFLNPSKSSLRILFENGNDTFSEVEEPVKLEWVQWSATLQFVNDIASWTIYRNGSLCHTRGKSGILVRPSSQLFVSHLVSGVFYGYVSSLDVWTKALDVGEMRGIGGEGSMSAKFSLLSFQMSEGVGGCLYEASGKAVWKSKATQWRIPPSPPLASPRLAGRGALFWKPSGRYYCVTNKLEVAVIEDELATWVDTDGHMIEQAETKLRPSDCCYYVPKTGKLFMAMQEAHGLRIIPTNSPPSELVNSVPSIIENDQFHTRFLDTLQRSDSNISSADFQKYLMLQVNARLLLESSIYHSSNLLLSFTCLSQYCLQTVGRALCICSELIERMKLNNLKVTDELLLCICGRLLIKETALMERRCPQKVISSAVEIYDFLQTLDESSYTFIGEAVTIFRYLHNFMLAECVSHEYQLQLICDCVDLSEIKPLLEPRSVPELVMSVIKKKIRKPLMKFLDRLKKECEVGARMMLKGEKLDFDCAPSMLSALLGMLSQSDCVEWHLVSVALVCSLCKNLLKTYEEIFASNDERKVNTSRLRQTAMGTVVFPVIHYLYDMEWEPSVAADALNVVHSTRQLLVPYTLAASKCPAQHFTEIHNFTVPAQAPLPYTTSLSLSHAQNIAVEVAADTSDTPTTSEVPSVTVSVIESTTLRRSSESLSSGRVQFGTGGFVVICVSEKGPAVSKPISFTIHAMVNVVADRSLWISDLCGAFGRVVVNTSEVALKRLRKGECGQKFAHSCLFAGGLFDDFLKRVKALKLSYNAEAVDYAKEVQAMLLSLAEGSESALRDVWDSTFESLKPPYKTKLTNVFRWCSCVIAWFAVSSPDKKSIGDELIKAMSWLKKKSFLLLEALQQGKEHSIVERAGFLMRFVLPRFFSEMLLQDNTIAEGPVDFSARSSNNISKEFSRGEISVENRAGFSVRQEVKDISSRRAAATVSASRRGLSSSVQALGYTPKMDTEFLPNEVLVFLLEQGEADDLNGFSNLLASRTQQAVLEAIILDLFREMLQTPSKDKSDGIFALILNTVVRLKRNEGREPDTSARAELSPPPSLSSRLEGCGLVCETKLQRSWCLFIREVIKELTKLIKTDLAPVRAQVVATCAILCRSWTVMDLQLLRPSELFDFLNAAMATSHAAKLNGITADGLSADAYWESKCFFDLFHRCLVVPNSLLQVTGEGVSIISGEVQGLHVENASVVCTARNSWKSLTGDCKIRSRFKDADTYANYGLPCVVSELPDVLYFEVTIDLSLSEVPQLSIGLSGTPVTSNEALPPDSITFSSDGNVSYKDQSVKSIRFSEQWRVGDTLGCGVFAPHNSVFFTHNGEFLGVASQVNFRVLVPFVEAQASGTLLKLIVNFGTEQPFKFDFSRVHGLSRCTGVTYSAVSDSVLITANYLIASCRALLAGDDGEAQRGGKECVSAVIEAEALFLKSQIFGFVEQCAALNGSEEEHADTRREQLFLVIGRLFHLSTCLLDFFSFDVVTRQACSHVYELCAVCLSRGRDKKIKLLAARCLTTLCEKAHGDFLSECMQYAQQFLSSEDTVQCLVDLARLSTTDTSTTPLPLPKWNDNTNLVIGKGTFYASSPLPASGTHVIGFRLRRRLRRDVGASLGGCYYIGLSHGHPQVSGMASLISRSDVYILQDTDDQDQVPHLLLRRYSIPRNEHHRIYGNDEIVWVEWNADAGEITYYRENMSLIGLAFANIQRVDNLYPIVYMFNDDASCELVPPPQAANNSLDCWSAYLRRSMVVYTLQRLHTVAHYAPTVSQFVQRCLHILDRDVQCCSIALALLGGERSFFLCEHDTYGLVVVYAIANISKKAIVHLATDESRTLFAVSHDSLKPSFVQTPLFALGGAGANKCAGMLLKELQTCLSEATVIAPLLREEQERCAEIEKGLEESIAEVSTLDIIAILQQSYANEKMAVKAEPNPFEVGDTFAFKQSSSECVFDIVPNVVERFHSSAGLYIPNPSIAVTTGPNCSVIRCAPMLPDSFTFSVSLTSYSTSQEATCIYVGVTTSTTREPDQVEDVASWEDAWPLCSLDSAKTNSVNCILEPNMIFSGDTTLFRSRDIVRIQGNRKEGTLSFSRVRNGYVTEFGVLFDGVMEDCLLRPFVACGADTVVTFSFSDGCTFPARDTFPSSYFATPMCDAVHCTSCNLFLTPPWFGGDENVALCKNCFNSWQYPKELFYLGKAPNHLVEVPRYMVSRLCPKKLEVGNYVVFEENVSWTWSKEKSVNMEMIGASCVSTSEECIAVTEPMSVCGSSRIDVTLGHIAGLPGCPFSGLLPFTPAWRVGMRAQPTCVIPPDSISVSCSLIPRTTKVFFSLDISETSNFSGVFVGVSNLSLEAVRNITRWDMEKHPANNPWGTWCDSKEKVSFKGHLFVLVDGLQGTVMISSSTGGLFYKPFVLSCMVSSDEDENLRLVVYSRERCRITSRTGLISSTETSEPSFVPTAIGVVPEGGAVGSSDLFGEPIFVMDTLDRTNSFSKTHWDFAESITKSDEKVLFRVGDTISFIRNGNELLFLVEGVLKAKSRLRDDERNGRFRFIVHFPVVGMTVSFVPPVYGKSHLGRIVKVHGHDIATVESASSNWEPLFYTIRRRDVRCCALAASCMPSSALKQSTKVAYKTVGFQPLKRGIIVTVVGSTINVGAGDAERIVTPLNFDQCFILDNESSDIATRSLYPLVVPPTSSITRVFEVGKKKYLESITSSCSGISSYSNGIMFDCKANAPIDLVGLSVFSRVSGRNQVDVFFKKGTHQEFERNSRSWTSLFSGLVVMQDDAQFVVYFPGVHVDSGVFSLYINTSQHCGVGFYGGEGGRQGEVGQELDTDGTLTVFLGKRSESSSAFEEFGIAARGFSGSIKYKLLNGTKPLVIEGTDAAAAAPLQEVNLSMFSSESSKLVCRPCATEFASSVRFHLTILSAAVRLEKIRIPLFFESVTSHSLKSLSHCLVSVLYCSVKDDDPGTSSMLDWSWAWNVRFVIDGPDSFVDVKGDSLSLTKGTYVFVIMARVMGCEDGATGAKIEAPIDPSCCYRNALMEVRGFCGELFAEVDALALSGENHVMMTGTFLSQSNSASYNGIMFELRSKEDITLEEIFCVSQTTAERVTVRVFWREGGMADVEKEPMQWQEVLVKEMSLQDKQLYSPGPLYLCMKAHQVYAIYINTTSSCGVRFYNSSDGYVGGIGDEFESDGVLSVYVGRKSESSSPFVEIPPEARAFRGKIAYRTFKLTVSDYEKSALFTYTRGYIVTRLLLALNSYVGSYKSSTSSSSSPYHHHSRSTSAASSALVPSSSSVDNPPFSYHTLLAVLTALVTSPQSACLSLDTAERALLTTLQQKPLIDLNGDPVAVPMLYSKTELHFPTLSLGDIAFFVPGSSSGDEDGTPRLVHVARDLTETSATVIDVATSGAFSVPLARLLPLVFCPLCRQPFASATRCPATGVLHRPAANEKERFLEMVSNYIQQCTGRTASHVLSVASELLEKSAAALESDGQTVSTPSQGRRKGRESSSSTSMSTTELPMVRVAEGPTNTWCYTIPLALLLNEHVTPEKACTITFPFVFCALIQSYVSLRLTIHSDRTRVDFVSDANLRQEAEREEAKDPVEEGVGGVDRKTKTNAAKYVILRLAAMDGSSTKRSSAFGEENENVGVLYMATAFSPASKCLFQGSMIWSRLSCEAARDGCPEQQQQHKGSLHASHEACVKMVLSIEMAKAPPLVTPLLKPKSSGWKWEKGSGEAVLDAVVPSFISQSIHGSDSEPWSCTFMVSSTAKARVVFLEIHIVDVNTVNKSSRWRDKQRNLQPPEPQHRTLARRPFSILTGEVVTLRFSHEGDFFIYDAEDVVLCLIGHEELQSCQKGERNKIGFVAVDTEKVVAYLGIGAEESAALPAQDVDVQNLSIMAPGEKMNYDPQWVSYASTKVQVSENKRTASCVENACGQAILGSPMPSTGISAFFVVLERSNFPIGSSLGSGHFAGVAVSTFVERAPHFSSMKQHKNHVWAIQDVQDDDSMPHQASIPPLAMEKSGIANALYCSGTRLLFILNRKLGTLSLSRNNDSQRIVFSGIPESASICPFVRLDNTTSSATLFRFTQRAVDGHVLQVSLEKLVSAQIMTPSLVRRFPLQLVIKSFPLFAHFVRRLSSRTSARLEKSWSNLGVRSRFEYRVSQAMETLINVGVFTQRKFHCDESATTAAAEQEELFAEQPTLDAVERLLEHSDSEEVVTIAMNSKGDVACFALGKEYEVLGRVDKTNFVHLLHFSETKGTIEQTFVFIPLSAAEFSVGPVCLLPHACVARQGGVMQPLNDAAACAVIVEGLYNDTLGSFCHIDRPQNQHQRQQEEQQQQRELSASDCRKVASTIIYGLEHWHLHDFVHGHITPDNVLVFAKEDKIVSCVLWNGFFLSRDSVFAPPCLVKRGERSMEGDLWGCCKILRAVLPHFVEIEPRADDFLRALESPTTELTVTQALRDSNLFLDISDESVDGPSYTLKTGSGLRGGSGSYNGIMFDIIAKNNAVRITKISFVPDITSTVVVSLYTRDGTFLGCEEDKSKWKKVSETTMNFYDNTEVVVDSFSPIAVAAGSRTGIFLHTTSGSGVLFFSKSEGVRADMGQVEDSNRDIGITVGKKSESAVPFSAIQNQSRLLKGSITYTLVKQSSVSRSSLIYTSEDLLSSIRKRRNPLGLKPVFVERRGGGFLLQTHDTFSLILLEGGQIEWVQSIMVHDVAQCEKGVLSGSGGRGSKSGNLYTVQELESSLREWRRQCVTRSDLFFQHPRFLVWRRLRFQLHVPQSDESPRDETDANRDGAFSPATRLLFVSDALQETCVVSVKVQRKVKIAKVYITDDADKMEVGGANAPLQTEDAEKDNAEGERPSHSVYGGECSSPHVFFGFDFEKRCVFFSDGSSNGNNVECIKRIERTSSSLRIVVELAAGASVVASDVELVAQCSARASKNVAVLDENAALVRPHLDCSAVACTGIQKHKKDERQLFVAKVGRTTVEAVVPPDSNAPGNPQNRVVLKCAPLYGSHVTSSFVKVVVGLDNSAASIVDLTQGCDKGAHYMVEQPLDCPSTPSFLLLEHFTTSTYSRLDHLTFSLLSATLSVYERRVVQTLHESDGFAKCSISSPRLTTKEIHSVLISVRCPTHRFVSLAIENISSPAARSDVFELPFAPHFPTLQDDLCGHGNQLQDVLLRLHIDLEANMICMTSSTGSVTQVTTPKNAAAEMHLVFLLQSPGSTVEVLDWETTSSRPGDTLTAPMMAKVIDTMGDVSSLVSTNLPLPVGDLKRHSPLSENSSVPIDHNVPPTKQMGVLIVSYARLLLEKTLLSQHAAREDAKGKLHYLLSFTSLRRGEYVVPILESELKRSSLLLLAQSCSYLLWPLSLQRESGVDTSLHILSCFLSDSKSPLFDNPFGTSLVLTLLHIATVHSRRTRHMALECAQQLLSRPNFPLPPYELLLTYLHPMIQMISGLCKRGNMSCAVVQIGVTLIADVLERYESGATGARKRYGETEEGGRAKRKVADLTMHSGIPFPIVVCARAVIEAIASKPPKPLPAALIVHQKNLHHIQCDVTTYLPTSNSCVPCRGVFYEEHRDEDGAKSFEVEITSSRKGIVKVGWSLRDEQNRVIGDDNNSPSSAAVPGGDASPNSSNDGGGAGTAVTLTTTDPAIIATTITTTAIAAPSPTPEPSCGYHIHPISGKIFVCVNGNAEAEPLNVKARAGDRVVVKCNYKLKKINVTLLRGSVKALSTNFKATQNTIDLPFFWADNKSDVILHTEALSCTSLFLNTTRMYRHMREKPDEVDLLAPQSYEFYCELNNFIVEKLSPETRKWLEDVASVTDGAFRSSRGPSSPCSPSSPAHPPSSLLNDANRRRRTTFISSHEIVEYPHVSALVGARALDDKVDLLPLGSYCYRLKLFDSLTTSFSPLINLHRKSELFNIFRVLKNICSKETEERIQEEVMRPFQHRAGRKAHVTLHTMQARPSAALGPYPTLMRSIFGQLYLQLHRSTSDTFYASPIFTVKLAGFGSTDAGGPYRDVLSQLAFEIMTLHPSKTFQLNPLFSQVGSDDDRSVIMPNVKMLESSQTPLMLEFFGKLLASFFVTNDLLAVEFPPLFWKLLLGEDCTKADICSLDARLHTDLDPLRLMERSAEEMEERFPGIGDTWAAIIAENPHLNLGDGRLPPPTVDGAELLISRVLEAEVARFGEIVSYIHSGFDQVVPLYTLQAFRWQKVELLICGSRKLSFEAFRSECDIQLSNDDNAMFLSVLEAMTDEDRALLLRFITGQSRLPLKSRIKVQHSGSRNTLPTSSTCFFTLRLPSYSSDQKMKERLLYASRQCKAIDADGVARENLLFDM